MLTTPEQIRELQKKLYRKAKQDREFRWIQPRHGLTLRMPLEEDDWKAVFGKTERTVWWGGAGNRYPL